MTTKRKRRRSGQVLWQNPLYQQKIRKTKDSTQTPPKTSITHRLRTDLGRSVGVTRVTSTKCDKDKNLYNLGIHIMHIMRKTWKSLTICYAMIIKVHVLTVFTVVTSKTTTTNTLVVIDSVHTTPSVLTCRCLTIVYICNGNKK